jgi:hypothetical protein
MNSGLHYVISQMGTEDCEKLPQIGYTVDCRKLRQRLHCDDDELTIVVTDLSEVFYGRDLPRFSAKLVKIVWDK